MIPSARTARIARPTARMLVALVLACTYFAFRVELFSEEAEQHASSFPMTLAFGTSTLSWETFDKENAPQAFTVRVLTLFDAIFPVAPASVAARLGCTPRARCRRR